jgi:hypothetical protein
MNPGFPCFYPADDFFVDKCTAILKLKTLFSRESVNGQAM